MSRKTATIIQICVLLIIGSMFGIGKLGGSAASAYGLDGKPSASPLSATGSAFTYQGRLTSGGSAASGQYDLQFTLFDALSAGNQVSIPVMVVNQTVTDGLFTVKLDFGPGAFQGSERWLELAVRPTGSGSLTILSPRQALTAAPYAMSLVPGATISDNSAYALLNVNNSGAGGGLYGTSESGSGVEGISNSGKGGYFASTSNAGVYGFSSNASGVSGLSNGNGSGVQGQSTNGNGVYGYSANNSGVFGSSPGNYGVYGNSSSGNHAAVYGYNTSDSGIGVQGVVSSTSYAVNGLNFASGYGVVGQAYGTGTGVLGASILSGTGVSGSSGSGTGVSGTSTSGTGVSGTSNTSGTGVSGWSSSGNGIHGTSGSGSGVYGWSNSGVGVRGTSSIGHGVEGNTNNLTAAVYGNNANNYGIGVQGVVSSTNHAVHGNNTGNGAGVFGESSSGTGIFGTSGGNGIAAVRGWSSNVGGIGVLGVVSGTNNAVYGMNTGSGRGGYFSSTDGIGVQGLGETYAVYGSTSNANGVGVHGTSSAGNAVEGASTSGTGVVGQTSSGFGVRGYTTVSGTGVYGSSSGNNSTGVYGYASTGSNAKGIHGFSTSGYAGYFDGKVQVNGVMTVTSNLRVNGTLSKAAGSFQIDHPLDPENKYLYHSFVESPDMMNIYNGNITLDSSGEAWVTMPAWFEALNMEFRYQLTAMGAPGPNLYVAQEIVKNRFKIAGGQPGMKVSWQVTGIRHDAYANAHRIPVEQDKSEKERGSYLYGQNGK